MLMFVGGGGLLESGFGGVLVWQLAIEVGSLSFLLFSLVVCFVLI